MSFVIAFVIGFSVLKIWTSLKMMPNLQRNERIMWMHLIVVFSYAFTFAVNSIIISGARSKYPKNIKKWMCAF